MFTDNFDGSSLDRQAWTIYTSNARSRDRVEVSGGELRLLGGIDERGTDITGGIATTLHQLYGRWEARIRIDPGAGYTATAILWPRSGQPSADGSIGFFEAPTDTPRKIGLSVRNGPDNGFVGTTVTADTAQWRTVAVEWLPGRVTFYVDGAAVHTVADAAAVPDTSPMRLALQLDRICERVQSCRDPRNPRSVAMHIDWVRVHRAPA